ncbi:MAG: hypothetical protein GX890_09055 [Firmicutes bacterium]|nr:hypothetical protein [Bacillota bacterium]HPU02088.1 hypothetical protein [Bacillota bacterium]
MPLFASSFLFYSGPERKFASIKEYKIKKAGRKESWMQQPGGTGPVVLALIILAIGLVSLLSPKTFWWLRIGRKAKDIPPVPAYLMVLRIGGALTCAVAIYLLYYIFSL